MTKPTNTMSDTSNHLISHPNTQWPSNTTLRYTPKILTHVHQKKKKKTGNNQTFHRCINFSIFYFFKKGNTTEGFKKNEAKCIITAEKQ